MKELKKRLETISSETKSLINARLQEFESFKHKSNEEWFSELCFCILTANSKALTAISIQDELSFKGFATFSEDKLVHVIKRNKHRFHNTKASRIVAARKHLDIKGIITRREESEAREWLVENVKGLGYKEASHFLRNVGYVNSAILDRHILNLLAENGLLNEVPHSLNKSKYLEIERICSEVAKITNMNLAQLDLSMWYLKTGKVLK